MGGLPEQETNEVRGEYKQVVKVLRLAEEIDTLLVKLTKEDKRRQEIEEEERKRENARSRVQF